MSLSLGRLWFVFSCSAPMENTVTAIWIFDHTHSAKFIVVSVTRQWKLQQCSVQITLYIQRLGYDSFNSYANNQKYHKTLNKRQKNIYYSMGTGILKLMKNASHSCCSFSTRFIVQKKKTHRNPLQTLHTGFHLTQTKIGHTSPKTFWWTPLRFLLKDSPSLINNLARTNTWRN